MYFEQFYLSCLSHASYMLASGGVAAVVDPQRDVELYLEEAARHGFRIQHVIETHLHADFVSGHRELAARTGATIHLGASAGATFPHRALRDGDSIEFGQCRLDILETPGHTLESISVLVTDRERSLEPFAVLTGDTLFIGDVGRPDLAAGQTPQQLAGLLYDSLHNKLLGLSDGVEVYPAHGAGSLCGRNLSPQRSSTIGEQRASNYALRAPSREAFIEMLTADLPPRPEYFSRDVELNRSGAAVLAELPPVLALDPQQVESLTAAGAVILDTRPAAEFGAAHIPGSIHIGLGGQFASWAGVLLGLDSALILVAEDEGHVEESRLRLARVGIEGVRGAVGGGLAGWIAQGGPVIALPGISAADLRRSLADDPGAIQVADVRTPGEWSAGHIEGAVSLPLHQWKGGPPPGLDLTRPVAVHCKGGYRSSIASSLLERAGASQVFNVVGGFDAWLSLFG